MYKCKFTDSSVKAVVRACTTEYVVAVLKNGVAHFIVNSPQVFVMASTKCEGPATADQFLCRLPAIHVSSAIDEGELWVEYDESTISLTVVNSLGKIYYATSVTRQVFPIVELQERMDILQSAKKGYRLESVDMNTLFKITTTLGGFTSVDNGVACAQVNSGRARVYKEVPIPIRLSIGNSTYKNLITISNNWYSYQNFLAAFNGSVGVLCTKRAATYDFDFNFIKDAKYKYGCTIDLHKIAKFVTQFKITASAVVIDIKNGVCKFESGRQYYELPVDITNVKCAEGVDIDEINIPTSILSKIVFSLPYNPCELRIKKNFVTIEDSGYYVVF